MNKKDLTAEVYEELRSRILDFKMMPGVRISDKDIAEELGLSRTPVRQALIRLSGRGLVSAHHNRGFFVKLFTIKEVQDLYTVRRALELLALELAIPRLTPNHSSRFKALLDRYQALIESPDRHAFNKWDEDFHMHIARVADNQLLETQLDTLHDQLAVLRRYAHLLADWPKRYESDTYADHLEIFNRMGEKNLEGAASSMARHIEESKIYVVEALKKNLS